MKEALLLAAMFFGIVCMLVLSVIFVLVLVGPAKQILDALR